MDATQRAGIEKAVRFIREHYREPFRVSALAAVAGYRQRWFRRLFREATGQGVVEHIVALRIEKAGELLRQTSLPILEIAYEVGFRNLGYFGRAFRRLLSATPAEYRRRTGRIAGAESRVEERPARRVFQDSFREPSDEWETQTGRWVREKGVLSGTAAESMQVALVRLLPENFRLAFFFRATRTPSRPAYALHVRLCDAELAAASYMIALGEIDNRLGYLTVPRGARPWSPRARLRYGEEQSLEIEFDSTTLRVFLDGEKVLSHREVFPARYADRCRVAVGYWSERLDLRDFRVDDLGVPPTVPTIRLGDTLFTEGMTARALSFYTDLLDRTDKPEEQFELRYKIGWAYLTLDDLDQAELWLRKLAEFGGSGFWPTRAALSLLGVLARRDHPDAERRVEKVRREHPELADEIEQVLHDEGDRLRRGGYFERALRLYKNALARPGAPLWHRLQIAREAESCALQLGRLSEARRIARIETSQAEPGEGQVLAIREISSLYLRERRFLEAQKAHCRAERLGRLPHHQVLLLYNLAILRRARGDFRGALAAFDRAEKLFAETAPDVAYHAPLYRAQILCGAGAYREAAAALARAGFGQSDPSEIAQTAYVPQALLGRYAAAADLLRRASRTDQAEAWFRAFLATIAAMLLEIGKLREEAKAAWKEVSSRFPATRVHLLADVAAEIAEGRSTDLLVSLPYDAQVRSEILYWAARLREERGDRKTAAFLLRRAVRDDPTRRWPAELARRRLARRRLARRAPAGRRPGASRSAL